MHILVLFNNWEGLSWVRLWFGHQAWQNKIQFSLLAPWNPIICRNWGLKGTRASWWAMGVGWSEVDVLLRATWYRKMGVAWGLQNFSGGRCKAKGWGLCRGLDCCFLPGELGKEEDWGAGVEWEKEATFEGPHARAGLHSIFLCLDTAPEHQGDLDKSTYLKYLPRTVGSLETERKSYREEGGDDYIMLAFAVLPALRAAPFIVTQPSANTHG